MKRRIRVISKKQEIGDEVSLPYIGIFKTLEVLDEYAGILW